MTRLICLLIENPFRWSSAATLHTANDVRTEVLGSEGGLLIGGFQQTPPTIMSPAGVSHDVFPWFPERFKEAYLNEMRYFVECVRADRFPSPDGQDDRAALEIALAATESLKSGRPVELSGRQRA